MSTPHLGQRCEHVTLGFECDETKPFAAAGIVSVVWDLDSFQRPETCEAGSQAILCAFKAQTADKHLQWFNSGDHTCLDFDDRGLNRHTGREGQSEVVWACVWALTLFLSLSSIIMLSLRWYELLLCQSVWRRM